MNIEQARFNMIEQQIRPWEVLDQGVLDLFYVVRREEFVPPAYRAVAFSDLEIPLGDGERMWAPKIEARVLQALAPKKSERVLEIGTGSGYFAALLAHLAHEVLSVEINPRLRDFGARNLKSQGVGNVSVEQGDAARGWEKAGAFDIIVLTGSTPVLPPAFLSQLKTGARLFAIVGEAPVMPARLFGCTGPGSYHSVDLFETEFPPLVNAMSPERFRF